VRATERSAVHPEYVLRELLRCGRCDEAMCPGSTTKKSGKTYRFYRCSTRDKHGKERCAARPLPAHALEDFVVERLVEATADGTLAARIGAKLAARIAKERRPARPRGARRRPRSALSANAVPASATRADARTPRKQGQKGRSPRGLLQGGFVHLSRSRSSRTA
jgi:hypothetical protein